MTSILIAEDEAIVAMDLAQMLNRLGYKLSAIVATGQEAVEQVAIARPDLVLMDVQLRGDLDGIAAASRIRLIADDLPIVYLTAYADHLTRDRAADTFPHAYLIKPFDEHTLQATIQMALARYDVEQRVRTRERWLATTLRSLADAVISADRAGQVTFLNPAAERLVGLSPQAALGQPIAVVVPLVDAQTAAQLPHPALLSVERGRPIPLAPRSALLDRAGRLTLVDGMAAPIMLEDGTPTGVVLVCRDVTHQRLMEQQIQALEQIQSVILNSIPDQIWLEDISGRLVQVNDAFARFRGRSRAECLGRRPAELLPNPLAQDLVDAPAQALAASSSQRLEECLPDQSGKPHWLETWRIPLVEPSGQVQGCVGISHDITEQRQTETTIRAMNEQLTGHVLHLEQLTNELRLLSGLQEMLSACPTVADTYAVIAQFARRLFPNSTGTLYVRRGSRVSFDGVAAWGGSADSALLPADCWALRLGRAHLVHNSAEDLICTHLAQAGLRSTLCAPLLVSGEVTGLLTIGRAEAGSLDEGQLQLIQTIVGQLELAIANLELRDQLRAQAVRDPLTGLYNRRFLEESLERALAQLRRNGQPFSLLVLDLDHFKRINDIYGHDAGDEVLRAVSAYLRKSLRESDIICRFGGEEFVVLLFEVEAAAALERAELLRQGIAALPIRYENQLHSLTVSIGAAMAPTHGLTGAALLATADAALYAAKRAGRNQVRLAAIA